MSHQRLTNFPHDPLLDLEPWVGQRQASFRFDLSNGITGEKLGTVTPIRTASLSHNTARTIKRQLSLELGVTDMAMINPLTDRVDVIMTFPTGAEYPMGRYMFTDSSSAFTTAGRIGDTMLSDEMFLVDQEILSGINGSGVIVSALIQQVLADLPITFDLETSPYTSSENWSIGSNRGQILESLSISGDYFSPWFNHQGVLKFIRTFDPAPMLPDFDWDDHKNVIRANIIETSDLLTAPNRFVVVSNAASDPDVELVATADVPVTAPHSVPNRGFVIANVQDLQLSDAAQAGAVVQGIANRFTVFEQVNITTAADPRHDSYNIIRWQDSNWLELAWDMPLGPGSVMSHTLRKAYS